MEEIEKRAGVLWAGLGVKSEIIKILQREYGLSLRQAERALRAFIQAGGGGMRGYWARARGGRVLHFFVDGKRTACGKLLLPHNPRDAWHMLGYKRCTRCVVALEKEQAKEEERLEVVG